METRRFHALMSDLHKLLSSYSQSELREAARESDDCRNMLLSLADFSSDNNTREQGKASSQQASESNVKRVEPKSARTRRLDLEEVENVLRMSGHAESTAAMNAVVRAYELGNVGLNGKDSKARNLAKLARAIYALPSKVQDHVLRALLRGSDAETQGWLDVIRNGR